MTPSTLTDRVTTVEHGGTDAGPAPRVDASTNANPYGPSPAAVAAVRGADVGPYPDPTGAATCAAIAAHHGCDPEEVVLGAGATELIDRLVRVVGGPVRTEPVTFGEYAGAAARHGVTHHATLPAFHPQMWGANADGDGAAAFHPQMWGANADGDGAAAFHPQMWGANAAPQGGVVFACSPGNPDGLVRDAAWGEAVARTAAEQGATAVWDLAYAPLVTTPVPVPEGVVQLHAPNKAHGCTGIRAGWLRAPVELAARLRAAAVTWTVSAVGHAFLRTAATSAADEWVTAHAERLCDDRAALVEDLHALGLRPRPGDAPFVLLPAPHGWTSRSLAAALRVEHAVKLRPTDSMGLPGHLRIAALPADGRATLVAALRAVLGPTTGRASGVERSGTRRAPASPPDARGPNGERSEP